MSGSIRRNLFWIGDYLSGNAIGQHYRELKKYNEDHVQGMDYQKAMLRALLNHAVSYSKFYSSYGNLPLDRFPVVNKSVLNQNYSQIIVDIANLPFQKGKMHIQKTSGSTGAPFAIPQDSRKRNRRIAELKYYGETVGFRSHETLCQCRVWTKWHKKNKWQSFRENIIPFNVVRMSDEVIEDLLEIVRSKKVQAIRAYASWYDSIIKYIIKSNYNIKDLKSLKVCFSSSEALDAFTQKQYKDLLGVDIVECYANEEGGVVGHQRRNDTNYYLNNASFLVEILKLDSDRPAEYGELGRVVITDLFNYAFPLIRYDTGDTAVLESGIEKSNNWPYISKLFGRKLDLVYDTSGRPIHPMSFARILKNIPGIIQWQFIQKARNDYELRLNTDKKIDYKKILDELEDVLGKECNVKILEVDEVPILESGKRKSVICDWSPSK